MVNKLIRILNFLSGLLLVSFLMVALVFVVPRIIGIRPYTVLSGSMEPEIQTGAIAYINTNDTDVMIGDIITYQMEKANGSIAHVTHRIVRTDDEGFVTRGDANEAEDMTRVHENQIVGTYLFSIPKLGYLASKLNKQLIMAFVGWAIFLNIFSFTLASYLEVKEETQVDVDEK